MTVAQFLKTALACLYVLPNAILRGGRQRVVLYYHAVPDDLADQFARQMRFIKRFFTAVSPLEILTARATGKPMIAVTFDDAFACLERNALPILSELEIPAAIFVPTGNLSCPPRWSMENGCPDSGENVMNETTIQKVKAAGFGIHSHTVSHPRLAELNTERLRDELVDSRSNLEKLIMSPVTAISYPHGSVNSLVEAAAMEAGYTHGFTITPGAIGTTTNPLLIPRTEVLPNDTLPMLFLKAYGGFGYLSFLRKVSGKG